MKMVGGLLLFRRGVEEAVPLVGRALLYSRLF
jgi:hypothetical protein